MRLESEAGNRLGQEGGLKLLRPVFFLRAVEGFQQWREGIGSLWGRVDVRRPVRSRIVA